MSAVWNWLVKKPLLVLGIVAAGLLVALVTVWIRARSLARGLASSQRSLDAERRHSAELRDIADATADALEEARRERERVVLEAREERDAIDRVRDRGAAAVVAWWDELRGRT